MKVLYIGYYREQSDWGRQTVNNILALEKSGVDVVCRCISLGGGETPQELKHLEDKGTLGVDCCIQHVFPEHMVGSEKFKKNVCVFANNFGDIYFSSWVEKLLLMDEIWVPSMMCWTDHLPEKIREKAKVIPFAIDTSIFQRQYKGLNIPEVNTDFKFYTVASTNDVTGLGWVIAAFHAEFDPVEPASLIIQVDTSGSGDQEAKAIEDLSRKIKSLLRINAGPEWYKKDVIIASQEVTSQNLLELHNYADCYVSCSTNVLFPLSEINAAGFGNTPIVSNKSSVEEYIGQTGSVPSIFQIVQSQQGPWSDTNNGKDFWVRPCEMRLRMKMRQFYEQYQKNPMKHKIEHKIAAGNKLNEYSLEAVGKTMEAALCLGL